jgi:mRNA interferase MazF
MGLFAKGAVVLVPYPFSDLRRSKLRPAIVLASVSADDYILCQIITKPYGARNVVEISTVSNPRSGLHAKSYSRPEKLFTGHESIIVEQIGELEYPTVNEIIDGVVKILRASKAVIFISRN